MNSSYIQLYRCVYGNGNGREWELNRWEWEAVGMLKAIPAHL